MPNYGPMGYHNTYQDDSGDNRTMETSKEYRDTLRELYRAKHIVEDIRDLTNWGQIDSIEAAVLQDRINNIRSVLTTLDNTLAARR